MNGLLSRPGPYRPLMAITDSKSRPMESNILQLRYLETNTWDISVLTLLS